MNPKTDADRLRTVIEKLDIDPYRLTLSLDYESPSIIYNILKGKQEMDVEFIEFFIKKYPQVNFLFLKEGKGNPILSVNQAISQRSILGLTNDELILENDDLDQSLNIIQKRVHIIENMLSNKTEEHNIDKNKPE